MDRVIIDNWNNIVGEDDIVYHLGDVMMGDYDLSKLKGRKVLIKGNHDKNSDSWYMQRGFVFVADAIIEGKILLTHKPTSLHKDTKLNIHGHLHNLEHTDIESFGETYEQFMDGRHILYAPEIYGYKPNEISKLIVQGSR
jgi:calcineurin-like phosphoesterase family protein